MKNTDTPPEIYAGEIGSSESFIKIQRARQNCITDTWINEIFGEEDRVKVSCLDMNEMLRDLDMFVDNEPRLDLGQVAQMKAKFENKVGKHELTVSVSSKRIPTYGGGWKSSFNSIVFSQIFRFLFPYVKSY